MCGILGGNIKNWNYQSALDCMEYRGPDGKRIESLDGFTLGFVRLSIRDLSINAMQPMYSKDKKVAILFNGEIYGYGDLKHDLINRGIEFLTTSDTEVILNAYLAYDDDFIDKIDGMFSIAIYDDNKKKIILYRDRMGIKPLYYYNEGTRFAFASELKAIQTLCNDVRFTRDNSAVYDYFTYRYIPEPKTLFKNVRRLEPGKKLTYDLTNGNIKIERYWKLRVNTAISGKQNLGNVAEKVRELIGQSVKDQLVADVPVGTFLSGGIDSSIVSVEIYKRVKDVQALSMGFEVNSRERQCDETEYAKMVANLYNFPITVDKFDKTELNKLRKSIKQWYDEPFADTSCYPTYAIAKLAKNQNLKVILTGDGGDEVFGGYTRYELCNQKWNIREELGLLKRLYTEVCSPYFDWEELRDEMMDAVSIFAKEAYAYSRKKKSTYIRHLGISKDYDDYWYFRKYYVKDLPPITRAQYIDFKTYLPADILTKVDRATMQNSIEARVPLLSRKLVEYSFALPQETRCPNGDLKGLLKVAYADLLPKEILYKYKKGFSFPRRYWSRNEEERFLLWDMIWKAKV